MLTEKPFSIACWRTLIPLSARVWLLYVDCEVEIIHNQKCMTQWVTSDEGEHKLSQLNVVIESMGHNYLQTSSSFNVFVGLFCRKLSWPQSFAWRTNVTPFSQRAGVCLSCPSPADTWYVYSNVENQMVLFTQPLPLLESTKTQKCHFKELLLFFKLSMLKAVMLFSRLFLSSAHPLVLNVVKLNYWSLGMD